MVAFVHARTQPPAINVIDTGAESRVMLQKCPREHLLPLFSSINKMFTRNRELSQLKYEGVMWTAYQTTVFILCNVTGMTGSCDS